MKVLMKRCISEPLDGGMGQEVDEGVDGQLDGGMWVEGWMK